MDLDLEDVRTLRLLVARELVSLSLCRQEASELEPRLSKLMELLENEVLRCSAAIAHPQGEETKKEVQAAPVQPDSRLFNENLSEGLERGARSQALLNALNASTIPEIVSEIANRKRLMGQMVGTLYPSVLQDEISRLSDRYHELGGMRLSTDLWEFDRCNIQKWPPG